MTFLKRFQHPALALGVVLAGSVPPGAEPPGIGFSSCLSEEAQDAGVDDPPPPTTRRPKPEPTREQVEVAEEEARRAPSR